MGPVFSPNWTYATLIIWSTSETGWVENSIQYPHRPWWVFGHAIWFNKCPCSFLDIGKQCPSWHVEPFCFRLSGQYSDLPSLWKNTFTMSRLSCNGFWRTHFLSKLKNVNFMNPHCQIVVRGAYKWILPRIHLARPWEQETTAIFPGFRPFLPVLYSGLQQSWQITPVHHTRLYSYPYPSPLCQIVPVLCTTLQHTFPVCFACCWPCLLLFLPPASPLVKLALVVLL